MKQRNLACLCIAIFCCLPFFFSILTVFFVFFLLTVSVLIGFVVESETVGKSIADRFNVMQMISTTSWNHHLESKKVFKSNKTFRLDKRISGSSTVDDALQEVLQHILREYVESWSSFVTSDVDFLFEVRHTLQEITINICQRCKEVDWVPFLTTKAVDYVTAHIRLYRQARRKWKEQYTSSGDPNISGPPQSLENVFFELEASSNEKKICRKNICSDSNYEKECLKLVADFILQLVGPKKELECRPVQLLTSQILNSAVVIPLLNLVSDPDYINQMAIWMCKDFQITSESFLNVLRSSESRSELDSSREMLNREIALLRSHDIGGEDDIVIKQRLSSLLYVKKIVDHRLQKMGEGSDSDSIASAQLDWNLLPSKSNRPLYHLPLPIILKNNVALSYMLDFMSAIGCQAYLFFLLNAEGWKVAAEQQIASMELEGFDVKTEYKNAKKTIGGNAESVNPFHQVLFNMQEAAMSIYEQYLSEKAAPRLRVDELVVRRLLFNIKNEAPHECWFDDVQAVVMDKLQKDERFMPTFLKSSGYVRLLAELDLLKDMSKSDEDETKSLDEFTAESASLCSLDADGGDKEKQKKENEESLRQTDTVIKASISQKGVVKEGLSSHVVYAVTVIVKSQDDKEVSSWVVYRRYSDFYDFHNRLEGKIKGMNSLEFPSKRTFNNMDKLFLERRQFLLNEYLNKLLSPRFLADNPGLKNLLLQFLDRGAYEQSKSVISRRVDNLVNPFVSSVRTASKAVRWAPINLFKDNTRSDGNLSSMRGISSVSLEGSDDVPLRILLFLIDEIFDLQNRNQWLRRRVFYMLSSMYGNMFSQRIVDSVAAITSSVQVAEFIRTVKNSVWPTASVAVPRLARDEATKMRTRVAAKMALLSVIPDEIKHLIGSETTRHGILRVFELFQNPILNRRLVYVFLEEIMDILFDSSTEPRSLEFFQKIHLGPTK